MTALIAASTASEASLRSALHARGLRCTSQRIAVMRVLDASGQHLSAPVIFEQLRNHGDGMDLTTVYRTLTTLTDVGLVHALAVPDGAVTYGQADHTHHHAVCPSCGRVTEIAPELLASVVDRLAELSGLNLAGSSLTLHAACAACAPDSSGHG